MAVTTTVQDVDLKTTCRICLVKQDSANLFCLFGSNKMFQDLSIDNAISDCFGIELKEDKDLPNCVCIKCASSTLQSYTFKQCLLKSQGYLEKWKTDRFKAEQKEMVNLKRILDDGEMYDVNTYYKNRDLMINYNNENINYQEDDLNYMENYDNEDDDNSSMVFNNKNGPEFQIAGVLADHDYFNKERISNEFKVFDNEDLNFNEDDCNLEEVEEVLEDQTLTKEFQQNSDIKQESRWWSKELGPPYNCRLCGRAYGVRFRAFYMHVRMHRIKKIACLHCGKKFPRSKMIVHMRSHTNERPYSCDVCPARFTIQGNLKRHILSHTGEKLHICEVCAKAFSQASALQNHKEQEHIDEILFVCVYCGKTFSSSNKHRAHLRTHNRKYIDINDDSNETYSELEKKSCDICGKGFTNLALLDVHSQIHAENKRYHCKLCFKRFNSHLNFCVHTLWHELSAEDAVDCLVWTCEFCYDTFDQKNSLMDHILTHMEKPFLCSICGKTYTTRIALVHHSRLHNDEKPFKCSECSKAFRSSATLRQHFRIHTGEKPHKCDVCLREFAQQQQLVSHLLTHTGEKNHVCPYCGKAFALNGNLTVHKRRHTGETPYVCDICSKGFYDSSTLKKHRRSQHKDVPNSNNSNNKLAKLQEVI